MSCEDPPRELGSVPALAVTDAGSAYRRWIGALIGALLLLTIIIPWGINRGTPRWSWKLFSPAYPGTVRLMLIGIWLVGIVALITGITRAVSRPARVYLWAGAAGVAVYLIGTDGSAAPWRVFVPVATHHDWAVFLAVAVLGAFLTITGVRARCGGAAAPPAAVRRIVCVAFGVVVLLSIFGAMRDVHGAGHPAGPPTWVVGVGLATAWAALFGCWLAFRDVRPSATSGASGTVIGRRLVLLSLAIPLVWGILRPALDVGSAAASLGPLNNQILLVGVSVLLLEGLVGVGMGAVERHRTNGPVADEPFSAPRHLRDAAAAAVAALVVAGVAFGTSLTRVPRPTLQASTEPARTGDWPQWCGAADRNMVSGERGLPVEFDEVTQQKTSDLANVKWVVRLSNRTLASPIVHQGKVFIGGAGEDNVGLLWCFAEADGKLLWRMQVPWVDDLYNRSFGICATPTGEGDRLYVAGHLGDVLCLGTDGLTRGNRGPFTDEAQYFATDRQVAKADIAPDGARLLEWTEGEPAELSPADADVLWRLDMIREANCWPYNALNSAIVVRGDRLFVGTGSTLSRSKSGETSSLIRGWKDHYKKDAYPSPSLVALDKNTGKLLASERQGIFEQTFHGAHSSPALAKVNGRDLLVYGGGNGTCYAFDPDFAPAPDGGRAELELIWKFDLTDPASYGSGFRAERPGKSEIIATPVIHENRVYVSIGNDLVNSGVRAGPGRLVCIDATLTGDVTRTARLWSFDEMRSSASTVAIADGLLYSADASGAIYCLDADTGKLQWKHSADPVWSSPLVAEGKVYVPAHNGGLLVFAHGREKKLLSHSMRGKDLVSAPAAANGVLYIASQRHLYALKQGSLGSLVPHDE